MGVVYMPMPWMYNQNVGLPPGQKPDFYPRKFGSGNKSWDFFGKKSGGGGWFWCD